MNRLVFLWVVGAILFVAARPCQADQFDRHTNPILQKGLESSDVQEVKSLTAELAFQNDRALPGTIGTFLLVRTNEGRNAKLLVQWAGQKTAQGKTLPMVLIDRFTCYREGEERAIASTGQNLSFFPGFRLSLDIGQIVPPELQADLACKIVGNNAVLEPSGKAKLYVVRHSLLPRSDPKEGLPRPGEGPFDSKYFSGTFKLNDDGRRTGRLELRVKDAGEITGAFFSDSTGQKYEVEGKVGTPKNAIQFVIHFPRADQEFRGWLFTGDARGLSGYSTMQNREAGFYAERLDEK